MADSSVLEFTSPKKYYQKLVSSSKYGYTYWCPRCYGELFSFDSFLNNDVEPKNYIKISRAGVPGWFTALCLLLHQCLWTCLQVLGFKKLICHAACYTVSRCCTRGESEDHTREKACKGSTLALKPRVDVTRSPKQGSQWLQEKDSSNNFLKKIC